MDWLDGVDAAWIWLTIGLVLAGFEMLVPGVYLIWLALAAIATGLIVLGGDQLFGSTPMLVQGVSFVFLSLIFVFSARRWLRESPIESEDPLLNNRGGRMIGQIGVVTVAIDHGSGRVKLGDSEWIAHGPDVAEGERVRIAGTDGAILLVEALSLPGGQTGTQPAAN